MAWVSPVTRATGYLVTAARWNQDVVDNVINLRGRAVLWLPAAAFTAPTTDGATPDSRHGDDISSDSAAFDPAIEEHLDTAVLLPSVYDGGDIVWKFIWTTGAGASVGDQVVWELNTRSIGDADDLDGALTAIGTVTDAVQADDYHVHVSSTLTHSANKPAAGDLLTLRISRKAAATADTLAQDALLLGVMAEF